jgi:PAS domain S-box-containing protein
MGIAKDKKLSVAAELRHRAEERLKALVPEARPPRTEDETPRSLHELQVHQTELEMQNEELRRAQEELELSRNKYFELYEFAPVGYFTIDAQGLIEAVNLKGAHLLGIERGLLLKRPFISFIAKAADREIFSKHLEEVVQKEGNQTCDIRLKRKYGTAFHAQLQSIAKENIDGKAVDIHTTIIDITDRKKAEEKIGHLASFPQLNPNPVIETDLKGEVIFYNAATMSILKKLNAQEDVRLFLPRDLNEVIKRLKQENEEQYFSSEVEINGRVFTESITYYAYLKVVHIYARDITQRRKAEDTQTFLLQCGYPGSGEDFFESLAKYLAQSLGMDYVCIDRLEGEGLTARTVAIYNDGKFDTNVAYTLKETPCGDVVGKTICCFPEGVCRLFPRDTALQDLKAESYIGTTLWNFDKKPIGLIAVIGRKPLKDPALAEAILKIVGMRAAGELERLLAQEALQKAHDELEQQVEERTVELKTALSELKTIKDRLEAENIYFRRENKINHRYEHILGRSDNLKYVLYRAEQVAPANTTVLILGETGTGKELIAAAIHNMSPRKERPLITVNCAALPGNLIESELFGREKGAFTGADTRQVGRFEVADGSTLCMDEIGELPLEVQAKLLRVIQHSEFERLGSSKTIKVDVRIIATTNRNLEEEVRKGRFRQDLYYRLNVFPITVPPLRQRKEDIPLMVEALTERFSMKFGKKIMSIQQKTMKELQDYPWPGNVRELENVIERAVILCSGPVLHLEDRPEISSHPLSSTMRTLEETERNQILKILSETRWRIEGKDGTAAILGLHPSTLRARMHKLAIVRPETKEPD